MSTYLDNHLKIQQLESRLNKSQYLSNDCLPNFIDAKVFKALKNTAQIPKREIYPHFYHWYVLMRQFADRTLEHWLKNDSVPHYQDKALQEILQVISSKNPDQIQGNTSKTPKQPLKLANQARRNNSFGHLDKEIHKNRFQSPKIEIQQMKANSYTEKKQLNYDSSIKQYLMSIKLFAQVKEDLEKVKRIFEIQNVQIQSVRISKESSESKKSLNMRVHFSTSAQTCEDLKNEVLKCQNVETIQCKKQRRDKSLR